MVQDELANLAQRGITASEAVVEGQPLLHSVIAWASNPIIEMGRDDHHLGGPPEAPPSVAPQAEVMSVLHGMLTPTSVLLRDSRGRNALHVLCSLYVHNLELFQEIFHAVLSAAQSNVAALVSASDASGVTPLAVAADMWNDQQVTALLALGADPNHRDVCGVTPLMAILHQHTRPVYAERYVRLGAAIRPRL